MGRVVHVMSLSLDGFVRTKGGSIDWTTPSPELHDHFNRMARDVSVFVHGRNTYELMAASWPTIANDPLAPPTLLTFGRIWMQTPKVVFSKTLPAVSHNSTLLRGGLVEEIARLKRAYDGDIWAGGPSLASSLVREGLIDEYRIVLRPIVLGGGLPFFPPLETPQKLRLLEEKRFPCDAIFLRYERAEA